MAIYNIDNIRSINEDKSDIARYDATAKERARGASLTGHMIKANKNSTNPTSGYPKYYNEPSYKAAKRKYDDDVRKGLYGSDWRDTASGSLRRASGKHTALSKSIADWKNDQHIRKINRRDRLKESKAKQAKLKEAAQYILDILDEQEYDNSNNYYYE